MKNLLLTTMLALFAFIGLKAQITTGLQAEYLLDGTTNDSHNSNNAVTNGSTIYGEDRFGVNASCFAFDGNTSISLPLNLTDGAERSISLWFLTGAPGGLIGHSGSTGYAPILYIGSDNKLRGKFWDGGQGSVSSSNKILTDSLWHHVVITADASGQKVYLDNQLVGSISGSIYVGGFAYTDLGYVNSASWPASSGVSYLSGRIDDVRIYDIAISDTVVNELYNTPTWTPPIYAWDLDTLYVDADATGNNDGSSWADAYTNARDAFVNTTKNCEIWIAEGTYIRNTTNRNAAFTWSEDSVMVYGGFEGNENSRDQRDWNANPTIFSGDIGVSGDDSDNAYTVFVGPLGAHKYGLIDGIKITGGNADVDSYPDINTVGGGMVVDTDVDFVEIKNVEFYGNYAKQGGALSAFGISGDSMYIRMENVVAHDNTGRSSAFAHIRASNVAPIKFEMVNCLIYENNALESLTNQTQDFGTVLFLGANANINNTIFATITNCSFANNTFEAAHKSKGMIRVFNQTNAPSVLNFANNICYGNGIEEITSNNNTNVSQPFPTINLNNNILENGLDLTPTVENNTLTSDPLFNTDYSLQQASPAIDAGTSVGVTLPMFDLAGNARVFGTAVDIGAYEFTCNAPIVSLLLTNGELVASGATNYQWFLDGVDLGLSNTTSTFAPTQDGEYYVIGTSTNACSGTSNIVNYCGGFIVEVTENNGTFSATSGLSNYQWFLDGAAIAGANSSTFTATSFGDYTVEAEQNGCTNTSNTINYSNVSIQTISAFENLNVYPNPTKNILNLEINKKLSSIKILDLAGKTVKAFNTETKQLDVSELRAGIYFLELANADKKSVVKIIKR